jgi:uncharacterized Tic20 family protein
MTNPAPVQPPPAPQPLSSSDEHTWAMLAHLSIVLNLFTGFAGPVAAIIIYLVYKDRSRYVAYHSLQSFLLQLIGWVGGGILVGIAWTLTGLLSAILIGFLCIPVAIILSAIPLGAVVYGIVAGIQTSSGKDFRYWLIGDWVRGTLEG